MRITWENFGRDVQAFSGAGIALCLASIGLCGCRTWSGRNLPQHDMRQFAFTADGRTLIGHGYVLKGDAEEGELRGWDVASGHLLWRAELLGGYCASSEVVPGGQTLVTVTIAQIGSEEIKPRAYAKPAHYTLIFRDARSGIITAVAPPTTELIPDTPSPIDIAPDGRSVVVTFSDRIVIWEMQSENSKQSWCTAPRTLVVPEQMRRMQATVSRAYFTADGKRLIVFSHGPGGAWGSGASRRPDQCWVDLWDVRTGEVRRSFGPPLLSSTGGIPADLSPDRRRIATFQKKEACLSLWDVESGRLVREARPKSLPSGVWGDTVTFLSPAIAGTRRTGKGESYTVAIRLTSSGSHGVDDNLYWEVRENRMWRMPNTGEWQPAYAPFTSPDGRLAARARGRSCSDEPEEEPYVYLLDPRTGRRVRTLEGEPERAARRWEGIY